MPHDDKPDGDNSKNAAGAPLDATAFELLGNLKQPGCPICRYVRGDVTRYLEGVSYELVNDPDSRDLLRKSFGYCTAHGQAWVNLRDALGTAFVYLDMLGQVRAALLKHLAVLDQAAVSGGSEGGLLGRLQGLVGGSKGDGSSRDLAKDLEPSEPCPACLRTVDAEERATASFARAFANEQFAEAYRAHDTGLCLPHFRQALPGVETTGVLRTLVQAHEACLARTCADLMEVIRKHDYRFSSETPGDEFQAPARSVEQMAGNMPVQAGVSRKK